MRVFAAALLAMSLTASPLLANDASETSKEDAPALASSASVAPDKPIASVKPESSAIESEMEDLRNLVEEQRAELESQRAALKAEQLKMEALEEKLGATRPEPATTPVAAPAISAAAPIPAIGASPHTLSAAAAMTPQKDDNVSPLFFKIGGAEFYPLGFMDLTNVFRSTTTGTGIGTSFNSVPENNTILGRVSEDRFSAQNSRIGLRTHAKFGDADVTGYLEADFLGFSPPNIYDTSNSDSLRMRLYWVDYKRGMWEVLGGQSWSLMTPNRNGLSAMPGDLFYSQDVDTNYQLGLTWARQAGIRFLLHPNKSWVMGLSIENPEQTLPGGVVLPATVSTNVGSQFDTNSGSLTGSGAGSNTSVPNLHPDVILKTAFDANPGGRHVHFDVAGLFRTFKEVNLVASTPNANLSNANTVSSEIHGGGIAGTANIELVKHFNLIATAFYSYGGGRYIASTAGPDVIVRPNGSLSGIHSGSGIGGFEYTPTPKVVMYGYYSGAYFGKNYDGVTSGGTTTFTGYGFPGSSNSANRYMYEPTIGIHYTMWRNPNYGDLRLMTQFSYVSRAPWAVTPITSASPSSLATAHNSMVFVNLRYDLP